MYIGYDDDQEALRAELRAYYRDLLTDEVREALGTEDGCGPVHREIVGQMGRDGWLTVGWPEEYGGRGYSAVEQFVMFDESVAIGAPIPMLTINTVGPTLMQYGTEEQKQYFLPKISKGEITFCIGYSEPDAGTDLAAGEPHGARGRCRRAPRAPHSSQRRLRRRLQASSAVIICGSNRRRCARNSPARLAPSPTPPMPPTSTSITSPDRADRASATGCT